MYSCGACGHKFSQFRTPGQCPGCKRFLAVRCSSCGYTAEASKFIANGDRCPKCGMAVPIPGGESEIESWSRSGNRGRPSPIGMTGNWGLHPVPVSQNGDMVITTSVLAQALTFGSYRRCVHFDAKQRIIEIRTKKWWRKEDYHALRFDDIECLDYDFQPSTTPLPFMPV